MAPSRALFAPIAVVLAVGGCTAEVAGQPVAGPRPVVSSTSPSPPPPAPLPPSKTPSATKAQTCDQVDAAAATLRESTGRDAESFAVAQAHLAFAAELFEIAKPAETRLDLALTVWAGAAVTFSATATGERGPTRAQRRQFTTARKAAEKLCGHPLPRN